MAPAWAAELVATICADAERPLPVVRWRRAARPGSSGVTHLGRGTLAVTAGDDPFDQRLTLLHELAHWVSAPVRRRRRVEHHGAAFYTAAFALFARHGLPMAEALGRESARYPSALRHARALGVPGAERAWRAHRRELRARAARRGPMRVVVPEHAVRLVRDGRWTRCAVCGVRVVGPSLRRLRRRGGRHVLLAAG